MELIDKYILSFCQQGGDIHYHVHVNSASQLQDVEGAINGIGNNNLVGPPAPPPSTIPTTRQPRPPPTVIIPRPSVIVKPTYKLKPVKTISLSPIRSPQRPQAADTKKPWSWPPKMQVQFLY